MTRRLDAAGSYPRWVLWVVLSATRIVSQVGSALGITLLTTIDGGTRIGTEAT